MSQNGTGPAESATPPTGLRIEVNLTSLARPPSAAELQAISMAVDEALRALGPGQNGPGQNEPGQNGPGQNERGLGGRGQSGPEAWRFSGRWWYAGRQPWGPRFSPVVD